jgi:hypothetical protein
MSGETQNDDGSWSKAEPLGWQHVPGGDWEVYTDRKPMEAVLYDEDVPIAVVRSRTRLGLALKMRHAYARSPR